MFVDDIGIGQRLASIGVGCLILFVGVAWLSSVLVKPLARVLGWPAERIGGAAGRLARENSMRNPRRTAATAAALMIGLALITFVAVLAQGLRSSVDDAIDQQVTADYVVVSDDNFTPFEPASDAALAAVPGAEVVGVRGDRGRSFGSEENVTGVDPGHDRERLRLRLDRRLGRRPRRRSATTGRSSRRASPRTSNSTVGSLVRSRDAERDHARRSR